MFNSKRLSWQSTGTKRRRSTTKIHPSDRKRDKSGSGRRELAKKSSNITKTDEKQIHGINRRNHPGRLNGRNQHTNSSTKSKPVEKSMSGQINEHRQVDHDCLLDGGSWQKLPAKTWGDSSHTRIHQLPHWRYDGTRHPVTAYKYQRPLMGLALVWNHNRGRRTQIAATEKTTQFAEDRIQVTTDRYGT